jgi:hypothetical protein
VPIDIESLAVVKSFELWLALLHCIQDPDFYLGQYDLPLEEAWQRELVDCHFVLSKVIDP